MALHSSFDLASSIQDERIRPFLPLVYLAWSDGELTPDEIEGICSAVAEYSEIDLECQVASLALVDAFAIPEQVLAAPIAVRQ
jgi:hypothetical protein